MECEMRFEPAPTDSVCVCVTEVPVGDLGEYPTWTNRLRGATCHDQETSGQGGQPHAAFVLLHDKT